jgi:hypothetical protein
MTQKSKQQQADTKGLDRRTFLGALGGASSVAVATIGGTLAVSEAQAQSADQKKTGARFKDAADQVKTFYRVNRY